MCARTSWSTPAAAPADRRALQAELIRALTDGPGVVVFEDAFSADVVDRASDAFYAIIEAQRADGSAAGDHFGKPGANDRIWNAAQKLALHAPDVFADYYANDTLAVVSQAWLGPRYQVTSQVNVVNPGGKQQVPHRDYHLGFVAPDDLAAYPAHLHRMSPVLTLQGAVAHCDMPIESGPTMLLPYSQRFLGGYIAFYRPEFIEFFAEHHVQVPLRKGDAVFFNPALYHGAGSNVSADIRRMANLLQISSPFGRAMEALDRTAMVRAVYPALLAMKAAGRSGARAAQRRRRDRRGLPVPHQPRPRPADRQPRPAEPGRHRAGRAGRRPQPGTTRCRTARPGRTENSMTTLGVIGLGRIGAFHTDTLSGLDSVDGLVITDERPDVVAAVAAKHGATPADSVEELLSSGIDGVVVAAATPAHAELTLAAVERGIPTFCEKPIAATAAESARVADVIARSGVPVQVGYQRRFDAAFAAAKRAVDDGSLGPLHTVRSTTMDPAPPPMDYIAGLRRHLPRLRRARLRRAALDHRAAGRRGVRHRQRAGRSAVRRVRRRRHRRRRGDVRVGHPRRGVGGPLQRPRLRLPPGGSRLPRHRGRGLGSGRAGAKCGSRQRVSRPARRTTSSWTASPRRSAPSSRRSSTWRTAAPLPACTVADAVEVAWLAEAATESLQARRPGTNRGSEVTMKIAGAPISWGVCEVPGWGYQLDSRPGARRDARCRAVRDRTRPRGLSADRPGAADRAAELVTV